MIFDKLLKIYEKSSTNIKEPKERENLNEVILYENGTEY